MIFGPNFRKNQLYLYSICVLYTFLSHLYYVLGDEHYNIVVPTFAEDIGLSRNVAENIWFAWNSFYLDKEDDFDIGREKMLQACYDLYPNRLDYYQTVSNAWASTGIGSPILSGDLNDDQVVNIQDIIIMINILVGGLP